MESRSIEESSEWRSFSESVRAMLQLFLGDLNPAVFFCRCCARSEGRPSAHRCSHLLFISISGRVSPIPPTPLAQLALPHTFAPCTVAAWAPQPPGALTPAPAAIFLQDKANQTDPNRVGAVANPLLSNGGLGTSIAKSDASFALSRTHNRTGNQVCCAAWSRQPSDCAV